MHLGDLDAEAAVDVRFPIEDPPPFRRVRIVGRTLDGLAVLVSSPAVELELP